jgi:hypothetical protein
MRWNRLILVVLLASLCFGGSFTCHSGDDHDDHHGGTVIVTKN